jgi:AcrR family transcriptional regulator
MEAATVARKRSGAGGIVRSGRPPRALAGEVEERILDAARKVFLERGFEGASIDEIADVARAGKPTIYARFPGKEALFAAVMARKVSEKTSFYESISPTGATLDARLASIGTAILRNVLVADTVGLARAAIAEARRFLDLAASVHRIAHERSRRATAGRAPGSRPATGLRRGPPCRHRTLFYRVDPAADADARAVRRGPEGAVR